MRKVINSLAITRLIIKSLIPVVLLLGGIVLVILPLSPIALIIGIPMTVIGTVFCIYTYDEVSQKTLDNSPDDVTICPNCHRPTIIKYQEDHSIAYCRYCGEKLKL